METKSIVNAHLSFDTADKTLLAQRIKDMGLNTGGLIKVDVLGLHTKEESNESGAILIVNSTAGYMHSSTKYQSYVADGKIINRSKTKHFDPDKDNLGVLTGAESDGLCLFDIDICGIEGALVAGAIHYMLKGDCAVARTPSGGFHVWFKCAAKLNTCRIWFDEWAVENKGEEFIRHKTYVTLFANSSSPENPSYGIWPNGRDYVWVNPRDNYHYRRCDKSDVEKVVDKYSIRTVLETGGYYDDYGHFVEYYQEAFHPYWIDEDSPEAGNELEEQVQTAHRDKGEST